MCSRILLNKRTELTTNESFIFFVENVLKENHCSKQLLLCQEAENLDVCFAMTSALSGREVLTMLCGI